MTYDELPPEQRSKVYESYQRTADAMSLTATDRDWLAYLIGIRSYPPPRGDPVPRGAQPQGLKHE